MAGDSVFLQKGLTLAVTKAEEHHVDILERHFCCEALVGFADQSFMYVADKIPRIALGVCKHNLCLGVVQQ